MFKRQVAVKVARPEFGKKNTVDPGSAKVFGLFIFVFFYIF